MGGVSVGGSDRSEWGEHAHQKTPASEDERRLEDQILDLLHVERLWTCKGIRGERCEMREFMRRCFEQMLQTGSK